MNNVCYFIKKEVKLMGINFFIPLIIYLAVFFYMLIYPTNIIILIELLIVPFSSWWMVWSFYGHFQLKAHTLLKTYPAFQRNYQKKKIHFFVFVYMMLVIVLVLMLVNYELYINLIVQFLPQTIFFAAISLLCMVFFKSVEISIGIIFFYVVCEILGIAELLKLYTPFFFNKEVLNMSQIIDKSLNNLIIGLVAYWVALFIIDEL